MSRFIVIALVLASIASLATAQNCSVGSADYFVPRLVNGSTVLTGGSLYYVIEYNKAAFTAVGSFDGAVAGSCTFVQANTVATTGCVNSHAVNMSITASQFTGCGFTAASSSSAATYTGRYKLTTVENAGVLRNIMFNRTVESAILFQVSFATTVNATSGNVSVYGAAITEAVITSQLFDTTSYVASLQITTSVQYPYVLTGLTAVGTTVQNFNTLTAASVSNGNCSSALTNACFQVFNLTLTPTNPCNSGASNLNNAASAVWALNFTVSCDNSRINCTGNPTPGSVLITFTTASPDYCPQVLGTITPTMTLTAYDGGNSIPQTFFVWGTRSYFRAVLSSPVDVEKVAITKVNLPTGGVTGLGDLYSRTYDSSSAGAIAAFWSADISSNSATGATVAIADSCAMMARSENNRTDPYVYFTINWSSSISNATGDNPLDTTVYVEARIKYAGSSGSAERVIRQKINTLETATPTSMGARAQVGVIQAESTPVSTAARSSSSSNMAIIAVASVGGAIAVLSVFAVVAIKKRRNSKEQQERMESVYLSRLETPASTA